MGKRRKGDFWKMLLEEGSEAIVELTVGQTLRRGLLRSKVIIDFLAEVFVPAKDFVGSSLEPAPDDTENNTERNDDAEYGMHGVGHDGGIDVGERHNQLPF